MEMIQSKFNEFFQNEKKKFLIIVYTIVAMIFLSFIFSFISSRLNNFTITFSLIWDNIFVISFFGLYLSIPQLIASKFSEKYRQSLYLKMGKKTLSLISSISFYFILSIVISFVIDIVLVNILALSDRGQILVYTLGNLSMYVFIVWFVSIIVGIISLVLNSRKSEEVVVTEIIPSKVYAIFALSIFFAILLLFLAFLFVFGY